MKVLEEFKDKLNVIYSKLQSLDYAINKLTNNQDNIDKLTEVIHTQNLIINSIINDKYTDNSLSVVIIKPYRGRPYIIKDGRRIDTENMTGFDADWSWDRDIEIIVRNE